MLSYARYSKINLDILLKCDLITSFLATKTPYLLIRISRDVQSYYYECFLIVRLRRVCLIKHLHWSKVNQSIGLVNNIKPVVISKKLPFISTNAKYNYWKGLIIA